MPVRAQPKIHQVHLRTHKLSILVTVPPTTTIGALKEEALSALTSSVNQAGDVPEVKSESDFELCKAVKEKGRPNVAYDVLDVATQLREIGLAAYDTLYLQFRDDSGDLLPVTFTLPPIEDDEELPLEDIPTSATDKGKGKLPPEDIPASSTNKGKRKAQFDDTDTDS